MLYYTQPFYKLQKTRKKKEKKKRKIDTMSTLKCK